MCALVTSTMNAVGIKDALPKTPHSPLRLDLSTSTSLLAPPAVLKKSFTVLPASHFATRDCSGPEADSTNSFGPLVLP